MSSTLASRGGGDLTRTLTIALDAMGGVAGVGEAVRGAAQVSRTTTLKILLVGDGEAIRRELDRVPHDAARLEIRHAAPSGPGLVGERRGAVVTAAAAVGAGEADALVSAGQSRDVIAAADRHIPRIPHVPSPALAAVYPTRERGLSNDRFALILDVGATVHCSAAELLVFAYMGHAYASRVSKTPHPSVALLNTSDDESAGDPELQKAHQLMRDDPRLNFIGNVDGGDVPRGTADVVVCEGYVGNVLSKMAIGFSDVLESLGAWAFKQSLLWRLGLTFLASGVRQLKRVTDYQEYGGAPYLGFSRMVIKAHGQSRAPAIANAIKVAAKTVRDGVPAEIESAVAGFVSRG